MGKTVVSKAGNARSFPPHTWSLICRRFHLEYALMGPGGGTGMGRLGIRSRP